MMLLWVALLAGVQQDAPPIPERDSGPLAHEGRNVFIERDCRQCHRGKARGKDLVREGPLWSKGWWSAFLAKSETFRPSLKEPAHAALDAEDADALATYLVPFQHDRMRKRAARMGGPLATPGTPPDLVRGEALYRRHCAACHGEKGKGDGPLGPYFEKEARPRSFVTGRFRRPDPTPFDIYLTLTRGMPGSGMAAFEFLPEADRWSLAHYVLKFSTFPPPKSPVAIPEPPVPTRALVRAGEDLFLELGCRVCHGRELKGLERGTFFSWADEAGRRLLRSRDLVSGIYRTGSDPKSLYREFVYGRGGTPMPSFSGSLHTEERRWALVYYVRSLFVPELKRLRDGK